MLLSERIRRMGYSQPLYVDITHSKYSKTLELAQSLMDYTTVDIMVHLSMTDMTKQDIRKFLDSCKLLGIRNLLCIRGDPQKGYDSWLAVDDDLQHCADLVRFVRKEYGDFFTIVVGGYPEGHYNAPNFEQDVKYLKEKVDAGADAIITQLFYDTDIFFAFLRKCREIGIKVPIIPGLAPIQTYATFVRIVSFTNISVPAQVWRDLEPIKHDDEKVKQYGIEYMEQLCKRILDHGINTLHFYTFNLERSVTAITDRLNNYYATTSDKELMLTNRSASFSNLASLRCLNGGGDARLSDARSSTAVATADSSNNLRAPPPLTPSKSEFPWENTRGGYLRRKQETVRPIFWANRSESYMHRTAHWDEFPNGRWGDSRSPAYGEFLDHHLFRQTQLTVARRQSMWGAQLDSVDDVSKVFIAYLDNRCAQLPWCSQSIGQETLSFLLEPLKLINSFGFLTINSQPQVNGAPSTDPVIGWGHQNGYVYQKAYLEFFCSKTQCERLLSAIDDGKDAQFATLSYQAINMAGKLKSNVSLHYVNAVTWGVFSNCEILQPTIVDPQSFIAWKDEAFSLWSTLWQSIYAEHSKSWNVIQDIQENWFLVNLVENDYINGNIFAPFLRVLQDEKDFRHIKDVVTSSLQSQRQIWCSSTRMNGACAQRTKKTENVSLRQQNDKEHDCKTQENTDSKSSSIGNHNPYVDKSVLNIN